MVQTETQLRWDLVDLDSQLPDDRLCQQHAAYRWRCGGVPINHDLLAGFRRANAALLDRDQEPALAKAGARACAGRGSLCKPKRLERIEQAVAERVAELKSDLDTDPGEPAQGSRSGSARSELCKQPRSGPSGLRGRGRNWRSWSEEKAARAKTHATEEANKGEPKVS